MNGKLNTDEKAQRMIFLISDFDIFVEHRIGLIGIIKVDDLILVLFDKNSIIMRIIWNFGGNMYWGNEQHPFKLMHTIDKGFFYKTKGKFTLLS